VAWLVANVWADVGSSYRACFGLFLGISAKSVNDWFYSLFYCNGSRLVALDAQQAISVNKAPRKGL
jgi:hypothetical protein